MVDSTVFMWSRDKLCGVGVGGSVEASVGALFSGGDFLRAKMEGCKKEYKVEGVSGLEEKKRFCGRQVTALLHIL